MQSIWDKRSYSKGPVENSEPDACGIVSVPDNHITALWRQDSNNVEDWGNWPWHRWLGNQNGS